MNKHAPFGTDSDLTINDIACETPHGGSGGSSGGNSGSGGSGNGNNGSGGGSQGGSGRGK